MNGMRWLPALILLFGIVAQSACAGTMPGDLNGDDTLTREELSESILRFLACSAGDGCIDAPAEQDVIDAATIYTLWGGKPKQVTDSAGEVRSLTRPLHRVVVMNSETLETMRSLKIPSSCVVAVDKYIAQMPEFFPEYQNTPSVGSIWSPDYEQILAGRPDAVFLYATVSAQSCDEIEQRIFSANPDIIVFRIDCYHPETYRDDVNILGGIFDRTKESDALVEFYTEVLDTLAEGLASPAAGSWPAVYFESWTDYKSAGPGSGYHDKIELAGGSNIFADSAAEYPVVDPEAIISRQPEVVVKLVGSGDYTFGGYSMINASAFGPALAGLSGRPGWNAIPAVSQGRVYLLHTAIFGGPQYIIGEAYLARWFYPDLFVDLDPPALHRTYVSRFQGLDPAVADPSLFVYPVP
ncbi:MAG: ABC transporter substrate-binding protein [Methanomicrobiaceae archaeon]|nr:ABC transporter substrate-binding protein [Methanomicrobiaceae archaeon]